MPVKIDGVNRFSPADRHGILPDETLVSINGNQINDILDYQFYVTENSLKITLLNANAIEREVAVKKGRYEDLGLTFESFLIDEKKSCSNKCIFCFIDQNPAGMRDTLYFKDDDSRMSFLHGNYLSLTNLSDYDAQRIIKMRMSPVNISVHTTNPQLRVKMMGNPRAADTLKYLRTFADAGISINVQIVVCPGINDGIELIRTLRELLSLCPSLKSVAVVPVGITRHRAQLFPLLPFTPQAARDVLYIVENNGIFKNERISYAADEFYLMAGVRIPDAEYYGDFNQISNGVGLMASLLDEFERSLNEAVGDNAAREISIATGASAYDFILGLAKTAEKKYHKLKIHVYRITNDFFGHNVTVAGLITGGDLLNQLRGKALGEELLIPSVMLRYEGDLFLDSVSLEYVSKELRVPVRPVRPDGHELLKAMTAT